MAWQSRTSRSRRGGERTQPVINQLHNWSCIFKNLCYVDQVLSKERALLNKNFEQLHASNFLLQIKITSFYSTGLSRSASKKKSLVSYFRDLLWFNQLLPCHLSAWHSAPYCLTFSRGCSGKTEPHVVAFPWGREFKLWVNTKCYSPPTKSTGLITLEKPSPHWLLAMLGLTNAHDEDWFVAFLCSWQTFQNILLYQFIFELKTEYLKPHKYRQRCMCNKA